MSRGLGRVLGVIVAAAGLTLSTAVNAGAAPAPPPTSGFGGTVVFEEPPPGTVLVPARMLATRTSSGALEVPLVTEADYRRLLVFARTAVKWWGVQVQFTRSETNNIARGTKYCTATVAVAGLSGPIALALGAACGSLTIIAGAVSDQGRCLNGNVRFIAPTGVYGGSRSC